MMPWPDSTEFMGAVSGFILKASGNPTVYIVGDCLYKPEIQANIVRYKPDWVVINSGGAIALPLSVEDGTLIMKEIDVVEMIKASPADTRFIAVHMEAIDHCQTTRGILRNEAGSELVQTRYDKEFSDRLDQLKEDFKEMADAA